jgi:hypothetical protein
MTSDSGSSTRKIPGWEEGLRELVAADMAFINSKSTEDSSSSVERLKAAISKIHEILATVIQSLIVPEDIGRNILSMTEGWENFWIDYDLLTAVHGPSTASISSIVSLDALGKETVDVMPADFCVDQVPENLRVIVCARRRLLKAMSDDSARLVLICARITAVDILLRQPRKSSVFLSSYFQSFPSFICQVASIANLMASRAISASSISSTSIESMIAYAGMSLLSTVITETNHVTQALSVLSANNPHAGILANLISLTLSPTSLQNGLETFQLSKAAIYVLMSSIQNARHPSTVANATMLRKILNILLDPVSHPEVTHACCVCLEVALEFCHNSFSILFRDLGALDRLIDRGLMLVDTIKTGGNKFPLVATQKALNSVFGLLRFSFQAQEINVGINLHEKLSAKDSPLLRLLVDVISAETSVIGKSPLNGCLTLVGNVMADDPLIISTLVDVGLVEALVNRAHIFSEKRSGDILSSLFVALGAVLLHESGAQKMKSLGNPLLRILRGIASDEFENSMDQKEPSEESRLPEDVGVLAGQTCDDVIRNRGAMQEPLIEETVRGLEELVSKPEIENLDKRSYPGLRILFGGLLSTTDQAEMFIAKGGIEVLAKLIFHPSLKPGAFFENPMGPSFPGPKHHPLVSVFKQACLRGGKVNAYLWQKPLAKIGLEFASEISEMNSRTFSIIGGLCLIFTSVTLVILSASAEMPSGPLLIIANAILNRLPDLFKFYNRHQKDAEWISASWAAVKNYISMVARSANSSVYHIGDPASLVSGGEVVAGNLVLNHLVVRSLIEVLKSTNVGEKPEITECVDLLNRGFVEDKNHAVRPLALMEFLDLGGFSLLIELLSVDSEPLLILFERITSFKRITNAHVTQVALSNKLLREWTVKSLNMSITVPVARAVTAKLDEILASENQSSTASTAVAKILSHAVMLMDSKHDEQESPRRRKPDKKRAKKSTGSRAKKSVASGEVNISDLLEVRDFSEAEVFKFFPGIELSSPHQFVQEDEGIALAKQTAQSFLENCLKLGDKGKCEDAIGELIDRHLNHPNVSIVPDNSLAEFGTKPASYVSTVCIDACFNSQNRTACAVLANLLSAAGDASKSIDGLRMLLEAGKNINLESENPQWIAHLLSIITRPIHSTVFEESLSLELQQQFACKLLDVLEKIRADAKSFGNNIETARTAVHACLANIATLTRRTENVETVRLRMDSILRLPASIRSTETALVITDILVKLMGSELISAVKICKDLDVAIGNEIPEIAFVSLPAVVELSVREPQVLTSLVPQMFKRSADGVLVRTLENEVDYKNFKANPEIADSVLGRIIELLLETIPKVDIQTCSGLSDSVTASAESVYTNALTVDSTLIMLAALLGEISMVNELDPRYGEVLKKYLKLMVADVGRLLVSSFSKIHDSTGAAGAVSLHPNVTKVMRVWADSVNQCSALITQEVLRIVIDELKSCDTESEDESLLRSYGYCALVFLLTEETFEPMQIVEDLIPLLACRLKRGTEISALCRFDSHVQLDAMYASLYALASRLRPAEVSALKPEDEPDEGDDADDEGDEIDEEMSQGSEDMSDDESLGDFEGSAESVEIPEEFEIEDNTDGEGSMEEESEEEDVFSPERNGSSESDSESENESSDEEIGYDDEQYGEGWSDYDVDWEEDDDEDDEEGIEGVIEGEMENGDLEVADYMMEPTGSPQLRPQSAPGSMSSEATPSPGRLMGIPPGPALFSEQTVERAKNQLQALIEKLEKIHESEPAEGTEEEDEPMEEDSSKSEGGIGGDLLSMTEAEQFAALQGLSAEERASIQQALGIEDGDEDFDDDDDSDDDGMYMPGDDDLIDISLLPPNVRISHNGRDRPPMSLSLEVPRNLPADRQASMINRALNQLATDSFIQPFLDGPPGAAGTNKKTNSKSQFPITEEIPKQDQCEKLCSDAPRVGVWSSVAESIVQALESAGSVTTRSLMLRHHVSIKPTLERLTIQLCFDPRSRAAVLSNLFSSLLKFVHPANSPWSMDSSDTAMPPLVGVFDGGQHPLLPTASRSMDVNAPGQCRSVGSGRIINMLKFIVEHVPRCRLWFTQLIVNEIRSIEAFQTNEGRRTPEKLRRRNSQSNLPTPQHGTTSSDGEGPLVRAISAQTIVVPPRRVSPLAVCVKALSSPLMQGSPSHAFIMMSLVQEILTPFPSASSDAKDCNSQIRQAMPEEAIQLLCELLVENKTRLRHMPEFDKAVAKTTQVLVSLCKDVKVREIVRQRLLATASRLVADMLTRLADKESSFSAVPLVRLFRTAKEAFGTKRVEAGESESFLDFAASVTNIEALWQAVDLRLSSHNNLLLSAPSVAQQALQKRRRESDSEAREETAVGDKITALETIAKLIPLVELYLSAHDVSAVWKRKENERNRPGRWSSEPPTEKENLVVKKAMDFIERHRKPINAMVKSRPSILNKAFAPLVAICPHLLDFDNKRSFFRTKLRQTENGEKHPPPQLKLTVRRDDVFRDSYAKLQIRSKEEWRGRLNITFQGEEGVDAGGLVREWFSILAREIFNPNYALFTPASGRPSTFLINPASSINPDHIHYFKFCGRFIGKAVFDNQRIDAYFVRSFYKHMLGQEVTWRDMEATDPDYFKNLNWILENDMTEVDYYSFTVEENEFGKLKVVELVPNGENIRVTEQNKQEYVRLVCEHKLAKGVQEQLKAFLQGFHELIPEQIVGSLFDDKELEMLISGLPTIDLEDLKKNTDYVHYTADSDQIKWFWKALEKFSEDELAWFLQFVTGSTQVPLEGFKGLAGMHGPQRFSIHRIRAEDRLPTAHTCFNQLDLPDYKDYETLESKLKQAVCEGHSGFGFI